MPSSRKRKKIRAKYLKGLSKSDKAKQKAAIRKSRNDAKSGKYTTRPKLKSFKSKKSPHVVKALKKFDLDSMKNLSKISRETGCSVASLKIILKKGRGAYYSDGSRPNQNADSWAYARLASAITGGGASKVDYKQLVEGKCGAKVMKVAKKPKNASKKSPPKKKAPVKKSRAPVKKSPPKKKAPSKKKQGKKKSPPKKKKPKKKKSRKFRVRHRGVRLNSRRKKPLKRGKKDHKTYTTPYKRTRGGTPLIAKDMILEGYNPNFSDVTVGSIMNSRLPIIQKYILLGVWAAANYSPATKMPDILEKGDGGYLQLSDNTPGIFPMGALSSKAIYSPGELLTSIGAVEISPSRKEIRRKIHQKRKNRKTIKKR